jgi:hypothetical protein
VRHQANRSVSEQQVAQQAAHCREIRQRCHQAPTVGIWYTNPDMNVWSSLLLEGTSATPRLHGGGCNGKPVSDWPECQSCWAQPGRYSQIGSAERVSWRCCHSWSALLISGCLWGTSVSARLCKKSNGGPGIPGTRATGVSETPAGRTANRNVVQALQAKEEPDAPGRTASHTPG